MAFAQAYKIQGGGGSINSRTVLRTDRPLSANSITSKSLTSVSGLASAPQRTKSSNSPSTHTSSSNAAPSNRRHSNGSSKCHDGGVANRVRVAVRLRPRNPEELVADTDFADCVELQPELKRLKLRKNIWDCETYQFDEVLTETASQKRVYEVVAKPVVEVISSSLCLYPLA